MTILFFRLPTPLKTTSVNWLVRGHLRRSTFSENLELNQNTMTKNILFAILSLIWFSCGTQKSEQSAATVDEKGPNKLSAAQTAEGWRLLFDGETMNGWRVFRNLENNSWEVIDGTLHCK